MNEFPKEALRSRKFTLKQKRGEKELDGDNVLVRRLCRTEFLAIMSMKRWVDGERNKL